jgi:hypothetical protein
VVWRLGGGEKKGKRKREKSLFGVLTFELFFFFFRRAAGGEIMPPLNF